MFYNKISGIPNHIIISRTDAIGDVVLTIPIAGVLKEKFPHTKITFLGRTYTKPIIQLSQHIDAFLDWEFIASLPVQEQVEILKGQHADTIIHVFPRKEIAFLAQKAGIKNRIGSIRRLFHLMRLTHPLNFTRKKSDLHEAQLNMKLLKPFGIIGDYPLKNIPQYYGFNSISELLPELATKISRDKFNLILHPKSRGSAIEWGFENFQKLIDLLPKDKFNILITGTKEEAVLVKEVMDLKETVDLMGKMSLEQLIALIGKADALIAASTGPLHIASALGIHAIGLYSQRRPIHPGRWQGVGVKAQCLVNENIRGSGLELDQAVKKIDPLIIKNILLNLLD